MLAFYRFVCAGERHETGRVSLTQIGLFQSFDQRLQFGGSDSSPLHAWLQTDPMHVGGHGSLGITELWHQQKRRDAGLGYSTHLCFIS